MFQPLFDLKISFFMKDTTLLDIVYLVLVQMFLPIVIFALFVTGLKKVKSQNRLMAIL